jgi:hypothetical protein
MYNQLIIIFSEMGKRIVRSWGYINNGITVHITLYSDNTYETLHKTETGYVREEGTDWHEDMLDKDYTFDQGDIIGIMKLKSGERFCVTRIVPGFDAYPDKNKWCIIS